MVSTFMLFQSNTDDDNTGAAARMPAVASTVTPTQDCDQQLTGWSTCVAPLVCVSHHSSLAVRRAERP